MRLHRTWRWLILGALCLAALACFVWIVRSTDAFSHCAHERKNYKEYQTLHKETRFIVKFLVRLGLNSTCGAHAANVYQGVIAALAGVVVAGFTGTLWWITRRSVRASETAAIAAMDAAKTGAQQFEISHRPWIPPTVIPAGQITYDQEKMSIPVVLVAQNIGSSPALNVTADCKGSLIPISDERTGKRPDPSASNQLALADSLVATAKERAERGIVAATLFPTERSTHPFVVTIPIKDIQSEMKGPPERPHIGPLIYGAVVYESIVGSKYETGFALMVSQARENQTPGSTPLAFYPVIPANGDIAAGFWTLIRHPGASGRTR
jgi:hypothetical protein